MTGPAVVVVGAGIAGASVAYFASQAGWQVTVVDSGEATASQVPSALLNPVRGQSGRLPPDALAGLDCTWQLIAELTGAGYAVPHGRTGVLRPVPDERTQRRFQAGLSGVPHRWLAPLSSPEPLAPGWHAALELPQGGWVDGAALCRALLDASGAGRVSGWAAPVSAPQGDTVQAGPVQVGQVQAGQVQVQVTEAQGRPLRLTAQRAVWCTGSRGAAVAPSLPGAGPQSHRAGTLLTLRRAPVHTPLSFGAYLAPAAGGGVLGGTFETPATHWQPVTLPLGSLAWLLGKGAALRDLRGLEVSGQWSGTRLSGLRCGPVSAETAVLTGLGSKGYLLGPLLARQLVRDWLPVP